MTEQPETQKLKSDEQIEAQAQDIAAAELAERLSLMIKYNHRGSLTSLDREQLMSRRNSAAVERGSKVDLLKTTLETNLVKKSSPQMSTKTSNPTLNIIKVNNLIEKSNLRMNFQ